LDKKYEGKIKSLRNLSHYRDKSDEELLQICLKSEAEKKVKGHFTSIFDKDIVDYLEEEETKILTQLKLESADDLPGLADYLFLLGMNRQFQKELAELQKREIPKNAKGTSSSHAISQRFNRMGELEELIRKYSTEIREWRRQLGLDDRATAGEDAYSILERYMKEAEIYIREHENEFTWKCPSCGAINLMERPHFAFDDGYQVWNDDLWQLVREKKITVEEMARVLRTSPEAIKRTAEKKKCSL
jgi:hypothetical protein